MLVWLQKYWLALICAVLLLTLLDGVISSLMTCHPITTNPGNHSSAEQNPESCTALAGPLLLSLKASIEFFDNHGEAVAAIFTIVLAAFTGRLWFSTEKLWSVTNESIGLARDELKLARAEFVSTHRPKLILRQAYAPPQSDGESRGSMPRLVSD